MNTRYKIMGNEENFALTSISHIGAVKREGDEWVTLSKRFTLANAPTQASVKFDSRGVCAVYINGEYVAANTGRYAHRVTNAECVSRLKRGENEIKILLGGHYHQVVDEGHVARRGTHFMTVAAYLEIETGDGVETVATDSSWVCESDLGITEPQCFSQVTEAEFDRFWLSAALWREEKEAKAPEAVLKLIEGYEDYIKTPKKTFVAPCEILSTNMTQCEGVLVSAEESANVLYRYDNIYCGYVTVEYEAESDGVLEFRFDYTGYPGDVLFGTPKENSSAKRLTVKRAIKKGRHTLTLVRRRACIYMMLCTDVKIKIFSVGFRLDMLNHDTFGYFRCSDRELVDMWEIGKYTHHICKHQEYESCPRSEMKYFTGDGILAALIDAYTFGEGDHTISSMAFTEITCNTGLIYDRFQRNLSLYDYPAWRIVQAYNHYLYYNDTYFAKEHFGELRSCLDWMMTKMNAHGLIYQYPVFGGPDCSGASAVDYSQHPDRLGEKPLLNALFYKSLVCMADLADVVGDSHGDSWRALAEKVKDSINTRLWSEEKKAYLETYNPHYIPEDGNALCVLFGIAEGERAKTVLKTLEERLWTPYGAVMISEPDTHRYCGNDIVSPTMNAHEVAARFEVGDHKSALELMRRCWGSMMRRGAKTFWEYADTSDGDRPRYFTVCHAWGAGCTYLLSAYVLGVRPMEAGYEKLLFAPSGELESFEGVVPTAKGLVAVKCETMADGTKKFTLALPKNTRFETELPQNAVLEVVEY